MRCSDVEHSFLTQAKEARETLHFFGFGQRDLKLRWTQNVADGALAGPTCKRSLGMEMAELFDIVQPPEVGGSVGLHELPTLSAINAQLPWASLDGLHAGMKGAEHADAQFSSRIRAFHSSARYFRKHFGFGKGIVRAKRLAGHMGHPYRVALAPVSDSTRPVVYESDRIARNWLHNIPLAAACFTEELQGIIAEKVAESKLKSPEVGQTCKAAKELRSRARTHLHVGNIIFNSLRHEHRVQCIIPYLKHVQKGSLSGAEAEDLQLKTEQAMLWGKAAAQGLCGVVRIWALILQYVTLPKLEDLSAGPRGRVIPAKNQWMRDSRPSLNVLPA